MIDEIMAKREMMTGLSAICAWCENYYNGQRDDTISCDKLGCGGPIDGRNFPAYKGPMEGNLDKFCFICGGDVDGVVDIGGRVIGICTKMGPNNQRCLDKLKAMLSGQKGIVVRENIVPIVKG